MKALRLLWGVLAVIGVALGYYYGSASVLAMFSFCTKAATDEYTQTCARTVAEEYGLWRVVVIALLLAAPPAAAALSGSRAVGWLAVVALLGLAAFGVLNLFDFWGFLIYAAPMAVIAVILAVVTQVVSRRATAPPPAGGGA